MHLQQRNNRTGSPDFLSEAPIGLMSVAPGGDVIDANDAQLQILGCRDGEIVGRKVSEFFADPQDAQDVLERLARKRTIHNFRARLRRKNGSLAPVIIDADAEQRRKDGAPTRWFVRDISARVALERSLVELAEREQHRVGYELHDSLGQHLHGLYYLAALLHKKLSRESSPHTTEAHRLCDLLNEAVSLTRGLARGLQPVPEVPEGISWALRQLAERTTKLFKVNCTFRVRGRVAIPDSGVATNIYRIAQEALNNALKHGRARHISLQLARAHRGVLLRVRDDGVGIRPNRRKTGLGLASMLYRAETIDGSLEVKPHPHGGTEVRLSVPLHHEQGHKE